MNPAKVIVIVGPTASGKSAVALELAAKIGGEIVNADSRQIYKHLAAGTAKPTAKDQKKIPHHLYDFLDPKEIYTAARYSRDAEKTLGEILARGRFPILVGGTGLYIRALFEGLSPLPESDPEVRLRLAQSLRENGKGFLHGLLAEIDPVSAEKIPAQNVQRVMRALEVFKITGKPLSLWHRQTPKPRKKYDPRIFGLLWKKESLKARIAKRTEDILDSILRETESLLRQGYGSRDPGFQSLGYKEAEEVLQGKLSKKSYFEILLKQTLHYAKRQMTWFRRDPKILWLGVSEPFHPAKIAEEISLLYNSK